MQILTLLGVLVVLTLLSWVMCQVHGQQRRLEQRLDDLALLLVSGGTDSAVRDRDTLLNALAGEIAPPFDLRAIGKERISLDALLDRAKPLLLVFADPRCGPCYELLPDIGGWQRVYNDRLTVALVSSGEQEINAAMTAEYSISPVLLQVEREVVEAYGLPQAPAAVLIQPDGQISAGPRFGARAIRELVADTLGLVLPEAPLREFEVARVGHPAPAIRRPDLDGNVIDLTVVRNAPTLLLFWSPGCSHCRDLLPEIKALEQTLGWLRMVIVSRGPSALNQEAGFISPVVLDDDHTIARAFEASGTPAAVLLDRRGVVVTQVARGSAGVRAAFHAVQSLIVPVSAAD